MLKSLSIRNVILIDKLDWELQNGFTVLSGETGAGKSILLDALGLLLGKRAEVSMIRRNCDKLSVCGCFEVKDISGAIAALCKEHELDFDNEIIIKRTLNQDGKGKIFFNDQPITQRLLKEIGVYLVEIHGQFDNQGLLDASTHTAVLDNYGKYSAALLELHQAYWDYKKASSRYHEAEQMLKTAQEEEENLRHWIQEFNLISPQADEAEKLEEKRRQAMNAEKINENMNTAYQAMHNRAISVRDALRQAQSAISRVNALLNDKYNNIFELLDTALVNVIEADEEIEKALNENIVNQSDAEKIEERLFALKDLARKHHVTVAELPEFWNKLEQQLYSLEKGADNLIQLREAEDKAKNIYLHKAEIVHQERVAAATLLDSKMMEQLPELKMERTHFVTQINALTENMWNENGYDEVHFMVSTNSGEPLGALNKIVSGGELARLMLALKVILGSSSQIETMVFDEVDTGIGGATAQAVGSKLAKLGETVQVLVVTHSPQVASCGLEHYKVEKLFADEVTTTTLRKLNKSERQEEIARMLAGEKISAEARAAAKVLIGE